MRSEGKHTGTPWKIEQHGDFLDIMGKDMAVARIESSPDSEYHYIALIDADFIVKACNAYDELVEVLGSFLMLCPRGISSSLDDVYERGQKVLAKSEPR